MQTIRTCGLAQAEFRRTRARTYTRLMREILWHFETSPKLASITLLQRTSEVQK